MAARNKRYVSVLVSGGLDSAAVLALYSRGPYKVHATHVQYRQAAAAQELASARRVAKHFNVPLTVIRCDGLPRQHEGLILGRNAFLLSTALMALPAQTGLVAIGIHAGTRYYDCSPAFVKVMQRAFDGYADGAVHVAAPFLKWVKQDIWAFCQSEAVPVDLTYSCERGGKRRCGRCMSCRDMEGLRAR
jgi:7-cyano-7-deazaguanine synthase